jgi:VTC domain
MPIDRTQKQRYELKFLVSEDTALLVRDFVRSYIDFDEHSLGQEEFSYPVHSLYLDSDELRLYKAIIDEDRNRGRHMSATTISAGLRSTGRCVQSLIPIIRFRRT